MTNGKAHAHVARTANALMSQYAHVDAAVFITQKGMNKKHSGILDQYHKRQRYWRNIMRSYGQTGRPGTVLESCSIPKEPVIHRQVDHKIKHTWTKINLDAQPQKETKTPHVDKKLKDKLTQAEENRKKIYDEKPPCLNCHKKIPWSIDKPPSAYKKKKFCNHDCAAQYMKKSKN